MHSTHHTVHIAQFTSQTTACLGNNYGQTASSATAPVTAWDVRSTTTVGAPVALFVVGVAVGLHLVDAAVAVGPWWCRRQH